MKFDDILTKYLGEFGTYQKIQFVLVCLPSMFAAMHVLSWTFTGALMPHRCLLIGENDTDSFSFETTSIEYQMWLFGNATNDSRNKEVKYPCDRPIGVTVDNFTIPENVTKDTLEECRDGYKWDHREITNSAVNYWKIVCGRKWLRAFIQSVYYVGQFFGSFVFGILADKFGRKKVFFSAIIIQILCGFTMAFVPWKELFAVLRVGLGFAHPGIFLIAVVIGVELVGPSKRVVAGVVIGIFFSIGEIILGVLAYFIRDYRHLQLAISLPALLFIAYWWFVSESSRWLVTQGRFNEADEILQMMAKCNKRELPSNWHEQIEVDTKSSNEKKQKYGFLDLFKTPNLRKRIIITGFVGWPAVNMVFYGLTMNPNFLGGDRYVSFITQAVLEIPALLIVLLTMNVFGRKTLCFVGFLVGGLWILATLLVPKDYSNVLMIMIILAKMSVTIVYAVFYVYVPELFPTVIRSTAMGLCSMIARLGATSASYIALWLAEVNKVAVVLIFGGVSLVAGGLMIFLPETGGHSQFETIEDAEKFGSNQPLFVFSWNFKEATNMKVTKNDLHENSSKSDQSDNSNTLQSDESKTL